MALDPRLFSLLGIYNGPWTPLAGYSSLNPIVNGTDTNTGHDNITLTGGALNLNVTVNGLSGNDFIDSRNVGLVNFLNGGAGNDQIYGGPGINTINGGDGNDYVMGGRGADILNGGAGIDTLSYESTSDSGITLTLNASGGVNLGEFLPGRSNAGADVIGGGFENVVGTNQDDKITGNASHNILIGLGGTDLLLGMAGNDTLIGGGGRDGMDGGDGVDTVSYETSPGGVRITFESDSFASGRGGDAELDGIENVENAIGSNFNDELKGDAGNNVLRGGGGADLLDGRVGSDTADYSTSAAGVTVNLETGVASGGDAQGDTFINIENITGSNFNDNLHGGGGGVVRGGAGNDTLTAAAGSAFIGGAGADTILGSFEADTFRYENVTDDGDTIKLVDAGMPKSTLDVSQIDANSITGGNQDFVFIGGGQFGENTPGQLRYVASGDIQGNVDNDADAEFVIHLTAPIASGTPLTDYAILIL
ncbi:hypothetical protein [Phyllobacterium zundukense]|uniref:Uncharacterized protein n=1 Tax=Phyllobacterium zundukense TaxID=1867719 RepID=A0ACD4D0L1_9HYPH|nr:hypothetical protein [Phyllobacterium zundukense]UXN59390.1 hypothetical protein N8E88_22715 [Phyllobacterium zundukense]